MIIIIGDMAKKSEAILAIILSLNKNHTNKNIEKIFINDKNILKLTTKSRVTPLNNDENNFIMKK